MDIFEKIELYHNLFVGSLFLCIICLILAVVLFFVLDIRDVLGYLTGRSARKKIKEMEEANASTGRLSSRERSNMQYVAQEMKNDMGVRGQVVPGARKVEHVVEIQQPQQIIPEQMPSAQMRPQEAEATGILRQKVNETEVLQSEMDSTTLLQTGQESETSLLKQEILEDGATVALKAETNTDGSFRIERELIFIHTDEVI